MELDKECESGMFSRSFQQEDFGEDEEDEGDHFIISLEDNGDECELLDEFDGALPSSTPTQETGNLRCGSLHTPPAVPAPVDGLGQGNLPAEEEKSSSKPTRSLSPGVVSQGGASVMVSGYSDPPLPSVFCPQWEASNGFEPSLRGESERNVIVSGADQTPSNPLSVIPATNSSSRRNGKDLETVQVDGESGCIWSETVFLSTTEGISHRSNYTRDRGSDQRREKSLIAQESTVGESQNLKLEKLLSCGETVVSSCDSEHLKETAPVKRPESMVSCPQITNGKESGTVVLNLPTVIEHNTGASSCHGNDQCTCIMCYKGRGIVDWFPDPKTDEAEGNLASRTKKAVKVSGNVKVKNQKRSRKQNLSSVSQPDIVFQKTSKIATQQLSGKSRTFLPEPVQQNPYLISFPETCGSFLFNQRNAPQILMVPTQSQTNTTVNKNTHILKSTDLPTSSHERCFLVQTVPKLHNVEVSQKSQPGVSKSSGLHPVNSGGSLKQNDCIINKASVTKNSAVGLSGAPLNHKPAQASKRTISNLVSLLPGKIVQGQSRTCTSFSPQILSKPTSILTKAPRYINPVGLPVSSHNIPLPPPLYCAPEKQASTCGQFIPVSKSMLIGKPSSSLSTSSTLPCQSTMSGTHVVILKTASTGLAPLSSTLTYSNVLSENQVILTPSSEKTNQHQAMYVTSTKNSPVSLVSTSDRSVLQSHKKIGVSQPGNMIITLEPPKKHAKSPQGSETQQKPTVLGKTSLLKDSPYLGQSKNYSSATVMADNVHNTTSVAASLGQQGPQTMSSMHLGLATDSKTPEQNSLSSLLSLLNQSTQLTSTASTVRPQKTTCQSPQKMELTQTLIQLIKSHLNSPTSGKDEQALLQAVKGLVETTEQQRSGSAESNPGKQASTSPPSADLFLQNSSSNGDTERGHNKAILSSPKLPSEGLPNSYIEDWVQQSRQYVSSCEDLFKTSFRKDMCDSPDWTQKDSDNLKSTGKVSAVRRTSAPGAVSSSCPVSQFNFNECSRETLILPRPKKPESSKSRRFTTLPLNGDQSKENTKKTPSASVIPCDKGLKLKIKLNEKVSTTSTAETVKNDLEYATGKASGSSVKADNIFSELNTKETKAAEEKPTRGETAEEMFQRFQEQAMQQVFNAQFGVGHVSRSLRPMRTTVSIADKFPPASVDQLKKKKLEEEKKAKDCVPMKAGYKKVVEPLVGKENVMKKKIAEGSRKKKPVPASEPSLENKLNLEDCPHLQQDNSIPLRKEIYCNNILAGHKVFVKFNIFENPVSERFFLVPFFNLGGSRTQFDKEDMEHISKAVAQFEKEKRMCARHLSFYNREGGKATFFRKASTSQALTEKDYHRYSFTLKGFSPEAPKRPQPLEEKWAVDSKIEIEIDRAEVEDEGVCNLENDGAVSNNLGKNEESLCPSLVQGKENCSGLVNSVSRSSQALLPSDVYSCGKNISGCLALSESIQSPTVPPPGKEENRSGVQVPTMEFSRSGRDIEKSTAGEVLLKASEENVFEKTSEDFAYTERLREMLLKENSSLSLEDTGILENDISAPDDEAALTYDGALKGTSFSPCGIKFFPDIKLEKPDDGYEGSMIPFHCQDGEGTQNNINNLDLQDTLYSRQAMDANSIHFPKSFIMQEISQVAIKQEPEDDGYLLASGADAVSNSAVEPGAALSQIKPVSFQKTVDSTVMVSGGEVDKDLGNNNNAKDLGKNHIGKDLGNNINATDLGNDDNIKDIGNTDNTKDLENNDNIKDLGNNNNSKDCEKNDREKDSFESGNKTVEETPGEEGKRIPPESEANSAVSSNKVREEDEGEKFPSTSESPLSSSSVSESSELSTSSELCSSDLGGSALKKEENLEEDIGELIMSHVGASLTEVGKKENPVQKKISSLVESLKQRLTQDTPPLPQWLVPDVKFKSKVKKKRHKKEYTTNCTILDRPTAAEGNISEPLAPANTTVIACELATDILSAPTTLESNIFTHSTASVCEPTISFSSASISSPVPFTGSRNCFADRISSSQNCVVAYASKRRHPTASVAPANTTAVQHENSDKLSLGPAGSSNLTSAVSSSLVTHNSSIMISAPTASVLSTASVNSGCTLSTTATKCLYSASTTSSSSLNVEAITSSLMSASTVPATQLNITAPLVTKESSTVVINHSYSPFQSSGSMLLPILRPEDCKTVISQIPEIIGKPVQISRPEYAQACSMQTTEKAYFPAVESASIDLKESLTEDLAAASSGLPEFASKHAVHFKSTIHFVPDLKKEEECHSHVTPADAGIVSQNCPKIQGKTEKTEVVGVTIRAVGMSDNAEVNGPLCRQSTPVSDFEVDVGLDDTPEVALTFKPIIMTPDFSAAAASEFDLLASTDLGFSPASSRSESPVNSRINQDQGIRITSKNTEEGHPKGFQFPFLQRKERKAQKREKKTVQHKPPEKTSIASYLCEKFAINIVPVMSNSKRPKVSSNDKLDSNKNAAFNTESHRSSASSCLPSVSKTPSLDQIFGTEVDKSLLKNKLSVSNEKLDKVEPSKKTRNGTTAQVARKGITGKRRRPQMKPVDSQASYTWRQLSRQSSQTSNLTREELKQCPDNDIRACRVVLWRLEDMTLGSNEVSLEEITIKQEIEDVVDSDTQSSSSKARRLVSRKKKKRGSGKQARKPRPREKKDIVDYYASMLESLQRKAQLLEEETKKKEMEEEEEKRRKAAEENEKEDTPTNVKPAGKVMINNLECSKKNADVIIQQFTREDKMKIESEQNSKSSFKHASCKQNSGFEASIVGNDESETVIQKERMGNISDQNVIMQKLEVDIIDSTASVSKIMPQEKTNLEEVRIEPLLDDSSSGQIAISHENTDSERASPGVHTAIEELNDTDLSPEAAPHQMFSDSMEERRKDVIFCHKSEEENIILGGAVLCTPNGNNMRVEDKNQEGQTNRQTSEVSEDLALKLKKNQALCVESQSVSSGFEKKDVLLAGCELSQSGEGETKSGEISEVEEDFLLGDELGGEGLVSIPEEEVEKLLGLDSHERMDMLESLEMEDDDGDDEERPLMIDEGDVNDFMDMSGALNKESTTQKPSPGVIDVKDSNVVEKPQEQSCTFSVPPKKESSLQGSPSWKKSLGAESLCQIQQEKDTAVKKAEISELKCHETLNKQASNNFKFKLKLPAGMLSKALRLSTEMKQVFGEEEVSEDIHRMAESAGKNEDGATAMWESGPENKNESLEKGNRQNNIAGGEGQVQPSIPKLKVKLDSAIKVVKTEFLKKGKKLGSEAKRDSLKNSKDVAATVVTDDVQFQLDMQFYLGKDVAENLYKTEPMVNGTGRASENCLREHIQCNAVVAGKSEPAHETRAQMSKDESIVENRSVRITRSKSNSNGNQGSEEKEESASLSLRSRQVKPSLSVSPDDNDTSVGQGENVGSEESLGIFSNAALFKTENDSLKIGQSTEIKRLSSKGADQLLKKNAFDIHRLKMKLNPFLKGTLGKMKKESPLLNVQKCSVIQEGVNSDRIPNPPKVKGSTTNVKDSESAFQKSVSDLGRVMKHIREKRSLLKRNNPALGQEEKMISKEFTDLASKAVSEASSNQLSSTAVQSASVLKINTAKLSSLLKSFKKPMGTNPGIKEHLALAGDADSGSREEGMNVEEAAEDDSVANNFHHMLKRKRGSKDLSCKESAGDNGMFKVPKMSMESKSLAKSKEMEGEEKGERSFFDCLPNLLMPAVWEET